MTKKKNRITLAEAHPELAAQWHPTKNGDLTPDMVTCGSNKKAWWLLPHDDPETGKHFDFVWEATIAGRVNGNGCPFLGGKAVWAGFNDLATKYPKLAKEWHPRKNGELTPEMVTCGSHRAIWWLLPYDDPKTGKHFEFEWRMKIAERANGTGCPFLAGRAVWRGYNDLATNQPKIAAEWHPTKNKSLTPEMVTCGSERKVWWLRPYDDSESGKHFDFEWEARINTRVRGIGCPYLSGRAVWPGYNDLATKQPELVKEWHYTRNGKLTPNKVTQKCKKKVWWLLPYDDPETGKHFDFEWEAPINDRVEGAGCPYLSGYAIMVGFNDLATKQPELAAQWHPSKNGDITPQMVMCNSEKTVWWFKSYDDTETGKHFDFEWQAAINKRANGTGCPFISGHSVWVGYNDLATRQPELAKEWHPTKNGNLTPEMVTCGSSKKVWWLLSHDDPETRRHFDFEWQERVADRANGQGCPFLVGKAVWCGYNDLATKRPDIAAQWHPTRNKDLTPDMVTYGSNAKVWWFLSYDDPETKMHYDFEWESTIITRVKGAGCPFLSGHDIWPGYNDLATKQPELAKEWHPTKNGDITPEEVTCGSSKKVWWLLPYDDPETGKHFDFEWEAQIDVRVGGSGCPYLSGNAIVVGFNDLETKQPKLAAQWHPTKNGDLKPDMVTCGSSRKVWWLLPYDDPDTDEHLDLEWEAPIDVRVGGSGCPYLSGQAVLIGFNDLATKKPELAAQWHPTKNGDITPEEVTCGSSQKVWWLLPYDDPDTGKHFVFEWEAPINVRSGGAGCPYLTGHAIMVGFNDLATKKPELAAQWHPTKNGDLTPCDVTSGSTQRVWWFLPYDDPKTGKHFDFEWEAPINARSGGTGCPFLSGRAVLYGYNDLNSKHPDLAGEWHPTRNRRKIPEQTYHSSRQKVWWLCSECGHEWRSAVYTRTCVDEHCPECKKRMPRYV